MQRRNTALLLSADYPDPFEPDKTRVFERLVSLTADRFDTTVLSLNRSWPGGAEGLARLPFPGPVIAENRSFAAGRALRYRAPPVGVWHRARLQALADAIAAQHHWRPGGAAPDLIVAGKLTVEGIIAQALARRWGVPYALCLQGNTDLKILRARPDLRRLFRSIYRGAAAIFPFAPWTDAAVDAMLGPMPAEKRTILPCATDLDAPIAPAPRGEGFVSVFHLRHHRNKNLAGMAAAMGRLPDHPRARLDIIGGAFAQTMQTLRSRHRGQGRIVFAGPLSQEALPRRLNRAIALVLPSFRETFGLVFIEALFAGLPVIYSRGTAIEGYFDGAPFALPVDPHSPASIAEAMAATLRDEATIKAALHDWQTSPASRRFTRAAIGEAFAQGLERAIADQAGGGTKGTSHA